MSARVFVLVGFLLAGACSMNSTGDSSPPPCVVDAIEPNDGPTARVNLGSIQDDDAPGQSAPSPKVIRKELSLHTESDVDWFDVDVRDTGLGGNPSLSVIGGDGTSVTAWWDCTSGKTESVVCGLGEAVTDDPELAGRGCKSQPASNGAPPQLTMQIECAGTSSDDGTLHIRVVRDGAASACSSYRLTVSAE